MADKPLRGAALARSYKTAEDRADAAFPDNMAAQARRGAERVRARYDEADRNDPERDERMASYDLGRR